MLLALTRREEIIMAESELREKQCYTVPRKKGPKALRRRGWEGRRYVSARDIVLSIKLQGASETLTCPERTWKKRGKLENRGQSRQSKDRAAYSSLTRRP